LASGGTGWPDVLAALVLDGVDQTLFQVFTNLPAFQVSRFLIYYRLVGVVAFELSQIRALLLTLIVTLYDRYHLVYQARFAHPVQGQESNGTSYPS
jgi:hypothetical protein